MSRTRMDDAFRRRLQEAKNHPKKRFADPRFPRNVPKCPAPEPGIAEYLEDHLPGCEFFGPQVVRGVTGGQPVAVADDLMVSADLTQNGLTDYAAILRRSDNHKAAKVIAFIQKRNGGYAAKELRFPVNSAITYLRVTELREVRSRAGLTDKEDEAGRWVYDPSIPDTTPTLIVANHFGRAIAFCFREDEPQAYDLSC